MVYMAGDNDLSAAGDYDIEEMRRVGSTDRVNILVEFDNAGDQGTRRFRIGKNGAGEAVESLGETDSGSPEVLSSFIEWAAENYPAERYALILWNHGGGWEPSEVERIARAVDAPDFDPRESSERSSGTLGRVLFRSSLERVLRLSGPTERAICSDDGSGHSLDAIELGRVIAAGAGTTGQPFDLLGMDACLMSNLEVAYQVRDHVRYIVASEEKAPGEGWPYQRILSRLTANPHMATEALGRAIVADYLAFFTEDDFGDIVTQAAIDLQKLPALTGPLDELAGRLTADMAAAFGHIWKAQVKSASFFGGTLWDLGLFCERLQVLSPDAGISTPARAVCEALEPGDDRLVIAEAHHGDTVQGCRGVSIYLKPPLGQDSGLSRFYRDLDFAQRHAWAGMLEAYHAR